MNKIALIFGSRKLRALTAVVRSLVMLIIVILVWIAYTNAEADATVVFPVVVSLVLVGIIATDLRHAVMRWRLG